MGIAIGGISLNHGGAIISPGFIGPSMAPVKGVPGGHCIWYSISSIGIAI